LEELEFSPVLTACCCATQALATVMASLVAGQVADRWVSADRCLTVCAFLAGIDLWVLAGLEAPGAVFAATLAFWLLCGPILMLGTAICFTHLRRPEQEYGAVRMWGTAGWMAAGWLFGLWRSDPAWLCRLVALFRPDAAFSVTADIFRLASGLCFVLAAYG